jgi:hypothetical protein
VYRPGASFFSLSGGVLGQDRQAGLNDVSNPFVPAGTDNPPYWMAIS